MKKILIILSLILMIGCDFDMMSKQMFNPEDIEIFYIDNIVLTVTEMEAQQNQWKVCGTAVSDSLISATWYIESMFYSDSTFTLAFGEEVERIILSLEPGSIIYWTITKSFTNLTESDYPNFVIKDLKAFIKK